MHRYKRRVWTNCCALQSSRRGPKINAERSRIWTCSLRLVLQGLFAGKATQVIAVRSACIAVATAQQKGGNHVPASAASITALIERELATLRESRVVDHIRGLFVTPECQMRAWDYGRPGETLPCWLVLAHKASNIGIAYCDHGFGPSMPWGFSGPISDRQSPCSHRASAYPWLESKHSCSQAERYFEQRPVGIAEQHCRAGRVPME